MGEGNAVAGQRALDLLATAMPGAVVSSSEEFGEHVIVIPRELLVGAVTVLRDHATTRYEMPVMVTAVDWPDREPAAPRFDVVYVLRSLQFNDTVRIVVRVTAEDPHVPSLERVYLGMDWHERETYDLFGIVFDHHHDLRRILLPDDWEGHPLRKDYISFGEPVAFTHNLDWALPEQERPADLPGEER